MRPIIELDEFMVLSASINYQLTSTLVNWPAILSLARSQRYTHPHDDQLISLLDYLHEAYGTITRRLGPLAVLHPIRTAALLYRTVPDCPLSDPVTALLHDKEEDLTSERYHEKVWQRLEQSYLSQLAQMDPGWRMPERIAALTRHEGEDYFGYLGRVLDMATEIPDLVRIKLADRLDNTLDLSVDVRSETGEINCFELIFDVLFTSSHLVQALPLHHPVTGRFNGSRRLYQLYKNTVFLSLLRQRGMDRVDEPSERLFQALAYVSLHQARQILVHLFAFHLTGFPLQRALLEEAKDYCQAGRIGTVRPADHPHRLDGVFDTVFNIPERSQLNQRLDTLYADKQLMALIAVAMAATFSSFRHDPQFHIEGIDAAGLHLKHEP